MSLKKLIMGKKMGNLFCNSKHIYFWVTEPGSAAAMCCSCSGTFLPGDSALLERQFFPVLKEQLFCDACIEKCKSPANYEYRIVLISEVVPLNSHFVPLERQTLVNSKCSVYEAASRQEPEGVLIKDRTVLALRYSWEGAKIGSPDMGRIEQLDLPSSTKKMIALIDEEKKQ
jgi:hypothetical protein